MESLVKKVPVIFVFSLVIGFIVWPAFASGMVPVKPVSPIVPIVPVNPIPIAPVIINPSSQWSASSQSGEGSLSIRDSGSPGPSMSFSEKLSSSTEVSLASSEAIMDNIFSKSGSQPLLMISHQSTGQSGGFGLIGAGFSNGSSMSSSISNGMLS